MANPEHLVKLKEGAEAFNQWRKNNPEVRPDLRDAHFSHANLPRADLRGADLADADFINANLSGADLRKVYAVEAYLNDANLSRANFTHASFVGANLSGADLRGAHLREAYLSQAQLSRANLRRADLRRADLDDANLNNANLSRANLIGANLAGANLRGADLREANLSTANLDGASLIETDLEKANLTSCSVYGISAWNVRLNGATQSNLVITRDGESKIEVDNLEVAQFIYLLLNNAKIRDVIDTITSKVVLILGRFTPERKAVLDAIRGELRKRNYLPVLFDFEKPDSRNFTETVSTLAHMARFVIADLTDPRSIPQELTRIIPLLPSVPIKPLLLASQQEYGMFTDFRAYPWVLEPYSYATEQTLLAELDQMVIAPAEAKAKELIRK